MKFIHTADLHLGYKFSSEYSNETLEILFNNQKKVLSNIIDLGIKNEIDALFIAGDLFDTPKISRELFTFVKGEFERAPFSIFIICGNHDPKIVDGVYNTENFGDNVYIFPEKISSVSFKDADIYGFSFSGPHKIDNTLSDFHPENSEKLNIFLSHGDLIKDSYYNPMSMEDIEKSGIDYLALGHIHLKNNIEKLGKTYYGYSGTPQGSTFKETGDTGVIIGEITKEFLKYEKKSVCEHNFHNLELNINMPETDDDIINFIKSGISSFNISKSLFNITLKGYISENTVPDYDYILNELKKDLLYIRINFELSKKYNLELLSKEESIRGEFVRNALRVLSDESEEYILKVIEYGVSRL